VLRLLRFVDGMTDYSNCRLRDCAFHRTFGNQISRSDTGTGSNHDRGDPFNPIAQSAQYLAVNPPVARSQQFLPRELERCAVYQSDSDAVTTVPQISKTKPTAALGLVISTDDIRGSLYDIYRRGRAITHDWGIATKEMTGLGHVLTVFAKKCGEHQRAWNSLSTMLFCPVQRNASPFLSPTYSIDTTFRCVIPNLFLNSLCRKAKHVARQNFSDYEVENCRPASGRRRDV
jgi:hypothetical protein